MTRLEQLKQSLSERESCVRNALKVACPLCGAAPLQKCIAVSGSNKGMQYYKSVHPSREAEYSRKKTVQMCLDSIK